MWDDRYDFDTYRFGFTPNKFLVECFQQFMAADRGDLPAGGIRVPGNKVLSLGEGEGRNAVYLASLGYDVTAVDQSAVGLAKTRRLAAQRGVDLTTIIADLNDYVIQPGAWDIIINSFCHMPEPERVPLHRRVIKGLKPGGAYILEIFAPHQLVLATRGPKTRDLVMSEEDARRELESLDLRVVREVVRHEEDDDPSTKLVAVLQVLGVRGEDHNTQLTK